MVPLLCLAAVIYFHFFFLLFSYFIFIFLRLAVTRLLFGSFKSLRAHTHLFATSVTNVLILSLPPPLRLDVVTKTLQQ